MIQIKYDEISNEISINIAPGNESGEMTVEDLVFNRAGIVGGIAGFLRDAVDVKTMNVFIDAIRALDESGIMALVAIAKDEEVKD